MPTRVTLPKTNFGWYIEWLTDCQFEHVRCLCMGVCAWVCVGVCVCVCVFQDGLFEREESIS